jgi:hypothetical protein
MNIKNLLVLVLLVTSIAAFYKSPSEQHCIDDCVRKDCAKHHKHSSHWRGCYEDCLEECYYLHS